MKKIMFNDKYGLTQAVLEGRKTQTRRIANITQHQFELLTGMHPKAPKELIQSILDTTSRFKVDEIVAVAQSYKDLGYSEIALDRSPKDWRIVCGTLGKSKGWNNKMFVRVDACKEKGHLIRITNIRIERLQDISDEDSLAEGVGISKTDNRVGHPFAIPFNYYIKEDIKSNRYTTPREAYAVLIDKISGKGTWESNPYVFVYDFELLK